MFIQAEIKKKLNLDVIEQLEDELEIEPFNYSKWNKLIKQVLQKDKESQVRSVFNKYLDIFKCDDKQWCNYINYEMNRGEFPNVEALFQKCFQITHSVDLCRLYVSYVRRVNDVITGGEKARGIVIKAFDFAVSQVGIDVKSGDLWTDYIDFLKSWTPAATWEQQQKIDLIRKVYKRYLVIPTEKIEASWSQYTKWENEVNASTASKFISEKSSEFMLARSWNTEWHNLTENSLVREIIPFGIQEEAIRKQLKLWHNWTDLEKRNTLELKGEPLQQRIEYVYKQSTLSLPFVPEVWFKFCKFLLAVNEEANLNRCIDLLKEGINFIPRSLLLSFQLAELYERDNNFVKSGETYNNLIDALIKDHGEIDRQISKIMKLESSEANFITEFENNDENQENDNNSIKFEDDEDIEMVAHPTIYQLSEEDHVKVERLKNDLNDLSKSITLAYVKLMMASKRFEGIKKARLIFKESRKKFSSIGYELYVENALMEHYSDNKKTALRIFELASKMFSTDGEFLLSYLTYLINNNEVDNIRKLIQSSDANISKDIGALNEEILRPDIDDLTKSLKLKELDTKKYYLKQLFKKYVSYALNYLSLDVAYSFANKCEQLFPEDDPLDLFSDRYRIGSTDLIKKLDLGLDNTVAYQESNTNRKIQTSNVQNKVPETTDISLNNASNSNGTTTNSSTPFLNEMGNQNQNIQQQSFVGNNIYNLLRVLPNASYFGSPTDHIFNNERLVELFSNLPNIAVD